MKKNLFYFLVAFLVMLSYFILVAGGQESNLLKLILFVVLIMIAVGGYWFWCFKNIKALIKNKKPYWNFIFLSNLLLLAIFTSIIGFLFWKIQGEGELGILYLMVLLAIALILNVLFQFFGALIIKKITNK